MVIELTISSLMSPPTTRIFCKVSKPDPCPVGSPSDDSDNAASVQSVRDYSLYTNLVLYPRWQGGEEDEFFAGEPNVDLDDKSKMGRRKLGRMKARGLVPTKEAPASSNPGETRQPKANKKKKIDAAATESAPIEVDDEEAAMNQ